MIINILSFIVILYIGLGTFAWFFGGSMIFQPPAASYQDNPEIIKFTTSDDVQLSGVFLNNPGAKYTILYSHGNAIDIGQLHPILQYIKQMGFSVFTYDYRGYGTSAGRPSEQRTYKDIEAAYRYLTEERDIPAARIIALGQSVGGGVATEFATRKQMGGLILESTFVSAYRVLTKVPLLPFDHYENLRKIDEVHCPVLIVHGTRDQVIPFWHGKRLFQKANEPKQSFWVKGAEHNNLLNVAGNSYQKQLSGFISLIEAHSN